MILLYIIEHSYTVEKIKIIILFFSFLPLPFLHAQQSDKIMIANAYYQKGFLNKAKSIYQELSQDSKKAPLIAANYLSLLEKKEEFREAEKFVQKLIKFYPNNMQYVANLAGLYKRSSQQDKMAKYFTHLKESNKKSPFVLSILAQHLTNENLYGYAIDLFLLSRELRENQSLYALELAAIYRLQNDKQQMIEEYLNYANSNQNRLNYIKNLLQNFVQEEEDLNQLEVTLIKKIQEYPDEIKYPELLIWLELQRKNFYGAFIQARAIDRRNQKPGDRTLQIGRIALDNKAYSDAEDIFEYVVKTYSETRNYSTAKNLWIKSKEEKIKNTFPIDKEEIKLLSKQYFLLYQELRPSKIGYESFRSMALLHAFYLEEIDKAESILKQMVEDPNTYGPLKPQIKLDLGDVYLLKGEPWESTLLYAQVEKENPSSKLSYDAKLRNARLNYFTGNFALAKDHLDILKKNTTRNICNDAISLGMLISDNTALDTSDLVMQKFADIEFLIYQNQKEKAKKQLERMLEKHEFHSISDEVYFLLSKLEVEMRNYSQAILYLDIILSRHRYDILADDAALLKAEIYDYHFQDVEKAKALYQQFLIDFPGSLYVSNARKRFRFLRGDLAE